MEARKTALIHTRLKVKAMDNADLLQQRPIGVMFHGLQPYMFIMDQVGGCLIVWQFAPMANTHMPAYLTHREEHVTVCSYKCSPA